MKLLTRYQNYAKCLLGACGKSTFPFKDDFCVTRLVSYDLETNEASQFGKGLEFLACSNYGQYTRCLIQDTGCNVLLGYKNV